MLPQLSTCQASRRGDGFSVSSNALNRIQNDIIVTAGCQSRCGMPAYAALQRRTLDILILWAASHRLLCSSSRYYYKGVPLTCSLSLPKDRLSFYLLFWERPEPRTCCPLESSSMVCPFADLTSLVGRDQPQMLLKLQSEAMWVIAESLNFKETSLECVWGSHQVRSPGFSSYLFHLHSCVTLGNSLNLSGLVSSLVK